MKCIKSTGKVEEVIRVSDSDADRMVKVGGWKFCPKKEWKAQK